MTENQEVIAANLATGEAKTYVGITPREAVIAAFAQERGDWNTWDYEERYGDRVTEGNLTFLCGDWSAWKAEVASVWNAQVKGE